MSTQIDDIARFDDDYKPAERFVRLPGPEALPDGTYVFTVTHAALEQTHKSSETLLKWHLKVITGPSAGLVIERPYFFRTQEAVDRLGADLLALGFDADRWSGRYGRKFSAELLKAIPKMLGLQIQGRVRTADDGKTYLDVQMRTGGMISGEAQSPRAAAPAPAPAPNGLRQPAPAAAAPLAPDDDAIPF